MPRQGRHILRPDRGPRWSIAKLSAATLFITLLLALTGVHGAGRALAAPGDDLDTAAIKVAFVYNFAKFMAWPPHRFASAATPFAFCVRNGALDRRAVEPLGNKQVGERPVAPRFLQPGDAIGGCHLLFVSNVSPRPELEALFEAARAAHVLLVSDQPDFARLGGNIALVKDQNRLRFQVNLHATQAAGLTVSSRLLRLAEIVGQGRE